jgi:hypothetical protein
MFLIQKGCGEIGTPNVRPVQQVVPTTIFLIQSSKFGVPIF